VVEELVAEIKQVEIEEEMKRSYIDYAMSVIVGRALPDVRDGLKPVHRRILYAMYDMGMLPGHPFKKCARIVGEVLGKYHPHGDMAVYDALTRLAQEFASRYPLIEGHGNFGSIDGDAPAAMRYTEARLSSLAMEAIRDIDKETVPFVPNFDETLNEPQVLPCRFPNLLVNGSSGIAVGMATNIPPHNLKEVIDGVIMLIENPEASISDLMKVIKGPDFPTGGEILGRRGIGEAYTTGRGVVKIRGKAQIEEEKGRYKIVISELPFQVNKSRLAAKIAELAREGKIREISDLRDESDREGIRLVIELKRDAIPQVALNKLYKHTQLETVFGVNMLALVGGVPKTLNLKEMLYHYLEHQKEVVYKRTLFNLKKAEERSHVIEGLLIALSHLDEVIEVIKKSRDPQQARERLMKKFKLTLTQAQAILDMKLQRLTRLEREKLETEHAELLKKIKEYKEILAQEERLLHVIKQELLEIKRKYGDERRTKISRDGGEITVEDLIADEEVLLSLTGKGYIKRLPPSVYRQQHRGGKGVIGTSLKEGDWVSQVYIATTHSHILFFTNRGRVYRLKVHQIPEAGRTARGQAIVNLLPLKPGEKVMAGITVKSFDEGKYILFVTKKGLVKKTSLKEYENIRSTGIVALILREGDELVEARLTDGKREMALFTRLGKSIRFSEEEIRPMGRAASGVKGISLVSEEDSVVGAVVVGGGDALLVTEKGYGKRTPWNSFPRQRRGGQGVKAISLTPQKGRLAGAATVKGKEEIVLVTQSGHVIRIKARGISRMGRYAQGVRLINLSPEDAISSLVRLE
jgi:DNA gyrase subunit A